MRVWATVILRIMKEHVRLVLEQTYPFFPQSEPQGCQKRRDIITILFEDIDIGEIYPAILQRANYRVL